MSKFESRLRDVRRVIGRAVVSLFAACLAPAVASAADAPDIVGLRTGMSEQQALAALQAHDAGFQIRRNLRTFGYRDGVQQLQTPAHLHVITATNPGETIRIAFSVGPDDVRVTSVSREVRLKAPPMVDQLTEQVVGKYGAPTVTSDGKTPPRRTLAWAEPGKAACWRTNPKSTAIAFGDGNVVSFMANAQRRGVAPADPAQCGYAIVALLDGSPVRTLRVTITDFGAWYASDVKAAAWVTALENEAVAARKAKGGGPKL